MTPQVSVIVPTLDEAKYLPALLESIRRQSVPGFEVIIADSGSTDATAQLAQAAGALVVPGERAGPGEGRNRGARAASAGVFLFADADCILPPNLIEQVLRALEEPDVIGGATAFMPSDGTRLDRLLFASANAYQRVMTAWGFPHNAGYCFFFRRETFERLGGLREDMRLNETHDLALRSRELGRFVLLPATVHTSMRRFRTFGYGQTIIREYLASTLVYYLTGRTPDQTFKPQPAR